MPLAQIDDIAAQTVRAGMKMAMAEGAGLGIGGMLTVVPDLSFLAVITLRTVQKVSLLYGFEYNTDEEMADLWVAAASAAGVDISRELMEKQVVSKFVPRVIQAIAAQASKEAVEKWAGRVIPVLSSLIGAGLNYFFVRAWSERAIEALSRETHRHARQNGGRRNSVRRRAARAGVRNVAVATFLSSTFFASASNSSQEIFMEIQKYLELLPSTLSSSAHVKSIFGDPVEAHGRTIIPWRAFNTDSVAG